MQYNSWLYLLGFLPVMVVLYYSISIKHRWLILLFGSLLFYYISSGKLIVFVGLSAFTVYCAALEIEKDRSYFAKIKKNLLKEERKKYKKAMELKHSRILILVVVLNAGILVLLKYRNFLFDNLNVLSRLVNGRLNLPHYDLFIPMGISFYTLTAISYVTDVSRGKCSAEKNFFKVLLFLTFFPVIIEGPIERYKDLGRQTSCGHSFNYRNICFGCQLIIWGLFQKVVLADRINLLVSYVFSHYQKYTGLPVITGILFYTFQLYMDFSGCIDICRGSAQLFGIQLTENFRSPFFSTSVSEFWRRWHISLGGWLKEYIFYPVSLSGFSRKLSRICRKHLPRYYASTLPAVFALFFVWISNGFWHGAEWKYIIYGLYYYLIMVIGMLTSPLTDRVFNHLSVDRESKIMRLMKQGRTIFLVNIGMLIFRAKDLKTACQMFWSVFTPYQFKKNWFFWIWKRGNIRKYDLLMMIVSIIFLIIYGRFKEKGGQLREEIARRPFLVRWTVYIVGVLLVIMFGAYGPGFGAKDFIYAQF